MNNFGSLVLPPEDGGDTGHMPLGEGVEVDVNGILLLLAVVLLLVVDDEEDEDGEIDKFNIEWAMLVWELEGRMIETGVDEGAGGGDSDPYRMLAAPVVVVVVVLE